MRGGDVQIYLFRHLGIRSKSSGGALLRAAKACLIHNTLLNQPTIEVIVNATETVAV